MDEYLREALRTRHWTIPQFAEACDVNTGLAQKWVSTNPRYRAIPGTASCAKIAAALGVDPDYVLELAGHRRSRPGEAQPAEEDLAMHATMAEMREILRGLPRVYWGTVIKAFTRGVEGARDMAQLLTESPTSQHTVSTSTDAAHSNPAQPTNSADLDGRQGLAKSKPAFRVPQRAMLVAL